MPVQEIGHDDVEKLVRRAAAQDERSWGQLVGKFGPRVGSVAHSHRLNPHDADDVQQTTWLRLLEHFDGLRDPSMVGAWLHATARHESLRELRRQHRERPTLPDRLTDHPAPEPPDVGRAGREIRDAVVAALDRLSERQRHLLTLLFGDDDCSYERIAAELDMPVGSIGPTRARGLAQLREDRDLMRLLEAERA